MVFFFNFTIIYLVFFPSILAASVSFVVPTAGASASVPAGSDVIREGDGNDCGSAAIVVLY